MAVLDAKDFVQYNFVLSNGQKSDTKANVFLHETRLEPPDRPVKKIVLWYDSLDAQLVGIQLFDKEGLRLLQTGWDFK